MFGDKAYIAAWTHARGLFKGTHLEPWQLASNDIMSLVRTGADEWPFGIMKSKM